MSSRRPRRCPSGWGRRPTPRSPIPAAPYRIREGGSLTLDGSASFAVDPADTIVSYRWSLQPPNGAGPTGATPTLDWATLSGELGYVGPGIYPISLTVTDANNLSETETTSLEVDPAGPDVWLSGQVSAHPGAAAQCGTPVRLDVLVPAFDPRLPPLPGYQYVSYQWDFGDGLPMVTTSLPSVEHTYQVRGVSAQLFTVTVTVTDNNARLSTGSVSVNVVDRPPVADAGGPYTVGLGHLLTLDASGSTSCANDLSFAWDLGDGSFTAASGATPTLSAAEVDALGVGQHLIAVRATDSAGESSTAVTTIDVQPPDTTPPVASPTQSPAPNTAGWNRGDVTVAWNWADNPGGSGIDPANCTASSTSSGEGTIPLTATCSDLAGNRGTASYTVHVDKTPPTVTYTGNAGSYTVDQQVAIACTAADALSGVASTTCHDVTGPAYSFALGTNSFSASATDLAGNIGTGSTTFTVTADATSIGNLTLQFVHGSARYRALPPLLQAVVDRLAAVATRSIARIVPTLSPAQKAAFLRGYDAALALLVRGGWLTADQAAILERLAATL